MTKLSRNEKNIILLYFISLIFKFLFATSFLLMPKACDIALNDGKNGLLYFSGAFFWITLIISIVLSIYLTRKQKTYFRENSNNNLPKHLAVFTFFSSKKAKIIDIMMICFIVVFVFCSILFDGFIVYFLLFLSILLVELHCLLNGKNYLYIKELKFGGKSK